jgi:hypothetical protein
MERICSPTPADIFIDSRSEKAELRSHKNLVILSKFECNNDKAISPDGKKLAFSATATGIAKEQAEQSDPQALQWVSPPCALRLASSIGGQAYGELTDPSSAR